MTMTFSLRLFLLVFLASVSSTLAQNSSNIEGVWQMRGYGWIFTIDDTQVNTYDTTSISCLPSNEYPREMMSEDYSIDGSVLTLHIGISTYTLDRLEQLPDICSSLSRKQKKDPVLNFEVLWNTFNEQYAYFELRDADWEALYKKYRTQVTSKTKDLELYTLFTEMLDELNDGHVDIEASDKIMDAAQSDEEEDADFKGLATAITAHYVKDIKHHNFTRSQWGTINDRVGFLQVNAMSAQADYGITTETTREEAQKIYIKGVTKSSNPMQDEVEGMNKTMHRVLKDIEGTDHLIIDVRFNGGGYDAVSFEILRFLINEKHVVFKKYARLGDKTTEPYLYELTPATSHFKGKVYFLQSAFSGSATETMLLASLQLPNTVRVGDRSEGILSDALQKVLPNGWEFTLSNEAYVTPDGVNYENIGIPSDHLMEYSRDEHLLFKELTEDLKTGDKAIEWVLSQVK